MGEVEQPQPATAWVCMTETCRRMSPSGTKVCPGCGGGLFEIVVLDYTEGGHTEEDYGD